MSAGFPLIGPAPDPGDARAALIVAHDAQGRILLQLRDDRAGVTHRGLWGLFGGGVEPGESLHAAAVREWREETGIATEAFTALGWLQSPSARRTRLYLFRLERRVAPSEIRLGEGAGFGFFAPDALAALPLIPFLRPLVDAHFVLPT